MARRSPVLVLLAGLLIGLTANVFVSADEPVGNKLSIEDREFFEKQVRPLLVKRCFECHGGTKAGGGLSLQTAAGWRNGGESGPAILPGKPEESLLIKAINYGEIEMPPSDKRGKLSADEIAILTKWVARGAPDPRVADPKLGGMTVEDAKSWWGLLGTPLIFGDS